MIATLCVIVALLLLAFALHTALRILFVARRPVETWLTSVGIDLEIRPGRALAIRGQRVPSGIYRCLEVITTKNGQRIHIRRVS